jgi:hypothetical protein
VGRERRRHRDRVPVPLLGQPVVEGNHRGRLLRGRELQGIRVARERHSLGQRTRSVWRTAFGDRPADGPRRQTRQGTT